MAHIKRLCFTADDNSVDIPINMPCTKSSDNVLTLIRDSYIIEPKVCSPVTGLSLGFEDLSTFSVRKSPVLNIQQRELGNTPRSSYRAGFDFHVEQKSSQSQSLFSLSAATERCQRSPQRQAACRSVLRFQSLPVPRREEDDCSQDSGIDADRIQHLPPGQVTTHTRFTVGDDEAVDDDSQESGLGDGEMLKDEEESNAGTIADCELEVYRLSEVSTQQRRLLYQKSQSFDLRSRPFEHWQKNDRSEDDQPARRVKRRASDVHVIKSKQRVVNVHSAGDIESAFMRGEEQENLIGDFSQSHALPLVDGRHRDLKCISAHTLMGVLTGKYSQQVKTCTIIDCRYPYEYEAGHIQGAVNVYTREGLLEQLLSPDSVAKLTERNIMVFHCEFSSERGPSLARFLREEDRKLNKYPSLHYPEIYLLEGGYKSFYHSCKELCEPLGYKPMNHEDHLADLRHFQAKSKSWAGDTRQSSRRTPFRQCLRN